MRNAGKKKELTASHDAEKAMYECEYGTPPSWEEMEERRVARENEEKAEQKKYSQENPVVSIFGSRVAFRGRFALPESDLDILYDGVEGHQAREIVLAWLARSAFAPLNVTMNLIPGRTHWFVQGYEYQPIDLLPSRARLKAAGGFAASVRAWAMRGGVGLPAPTLYGEEGPASGEAILNALEWARARGHDLNNLVHPNTRKTNPLANITVLTESEEARLLTEAKNRLEEAKKENARAQRILEEAKNKVTAAEILASSKKAAVNEGLSKLEQAIRHLKDL